MELLSSAELLKRLCQATGKWGMMVDFPMDIEHEFEPENEIHKAALWFSFAVHEHLQALLDGYAFLLFDSEEEMQWTYDQTVGDDGPTKLNSYDGKVKIYALTCSPDGELRNENT